jgi:hypothetical protein
MELQYDKEIFEIQKVIDHLNDIITSIQNNELDMGEIGKQKIPIVLYKRIATKLVRKQNLEVLQRPINVDLVV